jgi:hypothetical protein
MDGNGLTAAAWADALQAIVTGYVERSTLEDLGGVLADIQALTPKTPAARMRLASVDVEATARAVAEALAAAQDFRARDFLLDCVRNADGVPVRKTDPFGDAVRTVLDKAEARMGAGRGLCIEPADLPPDEAALLEREFAIVEVTDLADLRIPLDRLPVLAAVLSVFNQFAAGAEQADPNVIVPSPGADG